MTYPLLFEILLTAMLASVFYIGISDLLATFRKLRVPTPVEGSPTPPVEVPSDPSPSIAEGSYRVAPLRPDSPPDYDVRLKDSKLRPFVCGQTVLVRLVDSKATTLDKDPKPGPWFVAVFEGFSKTSGYTFIRLKSGSQPIESFMQCQTEMLHLEPDTNTTERLSHED